MIFDILKTDLLNNKKLKIVSWNLLGIFSKVVYSMTDWLHKVLLSLVSENKCLYLEMINNDLKYLKLEMIENIPNRLKLISPLTVYIYIYSSFYI